MKFQVSKPVLRGRERDYALDAIDSGWISSTGPYLRRFETLFGERLGFEDCAAVTNGTVALHLGCLAMDLQPGQEVVVPALTYVATANAVAYCNANPVFAEADPDTWNMTAGSVAAAVTAKTVGVIAVHLYGLPSPMEEIAAFCRDKGLWLMEDCAESAGARLNGKAAGSFGNVAAFSFYGNKTFSTGEGGMVVTRDPAVLARIRLLHGQGMDPERRYWHPIIGYNYRMTNVAAAIGCGQLEDFDYHLGERRRVAAAYFAVLASLAEEGLIRLPHRAVGYESSYWLFSVVIETGGKARRGEVMRILADEYEIETRRFFIPLHHLPMYESGHSFPVAERLGAQGISLPTYSGLAEEDIGFICRAFEEALRRTA